MEGVKFRNMGMIGYQEAWDYQESLLQQSVSIKTAARKLDPAYDPHDLDTEHHLLFCEHPPVFTLGKNGNMSNVLMSEEHLASLGIEFFRTNRGGDITFHGPGQIVGYPIFDLEKIRTDIGLYLRNIEQVVINTIARYGITGTRSKGETGVWIDPDDIHSARKICAIGVRCSRWVTMHGFALNVSTNLDYFQYIIPCGIAQKQVTSMQKELGFAPPMEEVQQVLLEEFEKVFEIKIELPVEIAP